MSNLINSSALVIYSDQDVNNNPYLRNVDWRRNVPVTTVTNPLSERYSIQPGSSQVIFSGTRTTTIDGTTTFSIALNAYNPSVYRIAAISGTAPGFRTDRALTLSTNTISVVVNNNATATFTITAGAGTFSSVNVGDTVFIPTVLTGDATGPFNIENGGFWAVLGKTSSSLTMVRLPGSSFGGVSESGIVLTADSQFQAFSSTGVQVGDTLEISAGFSPVTQKSFQVSTVTANWIEFVSTEALPLETGIMPGAAGLIIYSSAKTLVRIECDQEIVVRFNGDTGNTNRVEPRIVGDLNQGFGWCEKWGTVWSLTIVNRSSISPVNVMIISAEG